MSFIRPELVERWHLWRETITWGALAIGGGWAIWHGLEAGALLPIGFGLVAVPAGLVLMRAAIRRVRLHSAANDEGLVIIDEGQIVFMGPHHGGAIDLPAIVRVEIVTRPHIPPASAHVWVITGDDGTRLTIPLGAAGADALLDALTPLPGINFDAGIAAVIGGGPMRATVWRKAS